MSGNYQMTLTEEQDENGMYLHTHIFDDGTEITFNF